MTVALEHFAVPVDFFRDACRFAIFVGQVPRRMLRAFVASRRAAPPAGK